MDSPFARFSIELILSNFLSKIVTRFSSSLVVNNLKFPLYSSSENVSFRYPDASHDCIKNISFKVNKGETVAFIGATGSGKSTLVGLAARLYDATEGIVKVDGVEATDENIVNGTYKVSRPFIQIYKKGTDSELVKAWFDFVKSDEGKQVIEDVGLIPAE